MTDYSVVRDRWGRPFVTTDGGPLRYEKGRKTPVNAEAYTRVSTVAGALDDKAGLVDWAAAQAALGVIRKPAIAAQLSALASQYSDPWNVPEAKAQLKPIVERAREAAGMSDAADLGTAFHSLTEQYDLGNPPAFVPPQLAPWIEKYRESLEDWDVLDSEPFVVCDELQTAGSMDRLLMHRKSGLVVAADVKSGRHDYKYPLKVTMQVAMYANSVRYNQETGERTPLHPEIDLTQGILIHCPIQTVRPRCTLYPLDLELGMDLARLAVQVRSLKNIRALVAA